MESNLIKEEAIELAKKALLDIGHWEKFKIKDARYSEKGMLSKDHGSWLISFKFHENDPHNGKEVPLITINDDERVVSFVSWGPSSHFLLSYDKQNDKYYHPKLSREQPNSVDL
jgi:hypothetical protein